jgi:hypothetical protein
MTCQGRVESCVANISKVHAGHRGKGTPIEGSRSCFECAHPLDARDVEGNHGSPPHLIKARAARASLRQMHPAGNAYTPRRCWICLIRRWRRHRRHRSNHPSHRTRLSYRGLPWPRHREPTRRLQRSEAQRVGSIKR